MKTVTGQSKEEKDFLMEIQKKIAERERLPRGKFIPKQWIKRIQVEFTMYANTVIKNVNKDSLGNILTEKMAKGNILLPLLFRN